MTSTLILAALVLCGFALPVVIILSRASSGVGSEHDTVHVDGDCRHCAALTVPPIPPGLTVRVSIPRQPGGGA
ncbi:hypothetical protein [Streptomyces sp. NE06-03C]|uniref:hypothetical protein n=1 Tax=Streptomyces sp. NE06-03C TaxID=3028694 RepID=UPI0029BA7112|nr:hypothetical protein [Streptomyces sp. NE06-03C]MDX2919694.1 hypothetical protein [Streptomyces sp. NE06-03C]